MVEPTPTINRAYAMLIERKSQRSLSSSMSGEGTDLAALMTGKRMPNQYARGTSQSQSQQGSTSQSQSSIQHFNRGKKNWDKICDLFICKFMCRIIVFDFIITLLTGSLRRKEQKIMLIMFRLILHNTCNQV